MAAFAKSWLSKSPQLTTAAVSRTLAMVWRPQRARTQIMKSDIRRRRRRRAEHGELCAFRATTERELEINKRPRDGGGLNGSVVQRV
jgi:hypothetical protein